MDFLGAFGVEFTPGDRSRPGAGARFSVRRLAPRIGAWCKADALAEFVTRRMKSTKAWFLSGIYNTVKNEYMNICMILYFTEYI